MNTVAVSFTIYTLAIVAVGVYSARFAKRTSADFFLADRGLGAWVAALSSSASAESGWVTLGLVGMAFNTGLAALWMVPGTLAAFWFNWFVMARRLRQRSIDDDALTMPALLAAGRTGAAAALIRLVGVVIILAMLTAYVAAQLNAAGKTFDATFGMPYQRGVWLGAAIVLIYTVTGGFRAVAWTDVIQAVFMVAAVVLLPMILVAKMGGVGATFARLAELDATGGLMSPTGGKAGLALLGFVAVAVGVPLGYPGQPHVIVRLMAARDDAAIRRGGWIATVWVAVLFCGAILLGVAARAYYGDLADPEQVLPLAAGDAAIVPGVVGGVMIAAVLAAICSTADSQLLVSASAVSHDLLAGLFRWNPPLRTKVLVDRLAVLLVGGVAIAIATAEMRQVFSFVIDYGWAGLGAGFGPPLVLALLWKRTTGWGVLAGMITGVATAMAWKFAATHELLPPALAAIYNMLPALAASTVAVVMASYCTKKENG
jgi:sodium/proline symporter